jgi:glutaredoxin
MPISIICTIMLLLWLQPMIISADIYSWSDENGVKHFSNEPPSEIQKMEERAEHKQDESTYKEQDEERQRKWKEMMGKVPEGSDKSVTKNPGEVIMYSGYGCMECEDARRFFNAYHIPFTEYDIDKDDEALKRYTAFGGKRVPTIFIGNKRFSYFYIPHILDLFGIEYYESRKIEIKYNSKKKKK